MAKHMTVEEVEDGALDEALDELVEGSPSEVPTETDSITAEFEELQRQVQAEREIVGWWIEVLDHDQMQDLMSGLREEIEKKKERLTDITLKADITLAYRAEITAYRDLIARLEHKGSLEKLESLKKDLAKYQNDNALFLPVTEDAPVVSAVDGSQGYGWGAYLYASPHDGEVELFTDDGISGGKRWGTFYVRKNGSKKRLNSPMLPMRDSRREAQEDLLEFANKHDLVTSLTIYK